MNKPVNIAVSIAWMAGMAGMAGWSPADGSEWCVSVPATAAAAAYESAPVTLESNDGATIVDVMVVYTPSSRNAHGGTEAIETLIESYITYTNAAYEAGGVLHRFRLVHTAQVAYVESGAPIPAGRRISTATGPWASRISSSC